MSKDDDDTNCPVIDVPEEYESGDNENAIELDEKTHARLLEYLILRIKRGNKKRPARLRRYAKTDQSIVTWQTLSPEDSLRDQREEATGKSQALPVNLPVAQAYIDDAVSFYTEIFAPIGGNYYANPGKRNKTAAVQLLTKKMNQDSMINQYYTNVTTTMRALNKYNVGGFHVYWVESDDAQQSTGNVCEAIDMYNFIYDESVVDIKNVHRDAEYTAMMKIRNRLWLIRQLGQPNTMNLDKVLEEDEQRNAPYVNATYYRYPPDVTNMDKDGNDSKSSESSGGNINWESFGLGDSDNGIEINGNEIIVMYCWLNPDQFGLDRDEQSSNPLALYRITICNAKWIIGMELIPNAVEIPTYVARLNQDEMGEAQRAMAEFIKPFQRIVSFLFNTHVDGIKSNVWGVKAIDPKMFDPGVLKNGETSALLVSKVPGRDVRSGLMKLDMSTDTSQNLQEAATILDLMKIFFPNQAMPGQIASMDRAVTSQVSAVLQGTMRKMHMFVRNLDSALMLPVRQAMYRNIAANDPEKSQFTDVSGEEVAELLASGLGQMSREAAAEQVRSLIFALIQNPDSAGGIDIRGLFTLYSLLLNIGTDLGEFALTPTTAPNPSGDPNAGQPGAESAGAPAPQQVPQVA